MATATHASRHPGACRVLSGAGLPVRAGVAGGERGRLRGGRPIVDTGAIRQRTRQAWQARAAEQRQRVSEERLALAREVHDVVARRFRR